jgi:GNAT superfamily N-acetyltransferase
MRKSPPFAPAFAQPLQEPALTDPIAHTRVAYRALRTDDLPAAARLTQSLGWPHRVEDWALVQRLGQGVVAVDAASPGTVLGTTLYWTFGEAFASIGLVVVSPDCQGAGIGRALMTRALHALADRHVMLNATEAGRPLYEKLGFVAFGEVSQHQGTALPMPPAPLPGGTVLRAVATGDAPRIRQLAARATGMPRDAVMDELLHVGEAVAIDRNGELTGLACLRRFGRGHVIGPVVAPDIASAKALIGHWVSRHGGSFLRADIPAHPALSDWLDSQGLTRVDGGTSMVKGTPPTQDAHARLFALVNQALH